MFDRFASRSAAFVALMACLSIASARAADAPAAASEMTLDALSVDHREILVLIDIEERTEREVADLLSLPVGTVRSRVHRARQSFLTVAHRMQLPAVVFERVREGT